MSHELSLSARQAEPTGEAVSHGAMRSTLFVIPLTEVATAYEVLL
jgi:hypothetical protein